MIAPQQQFIVTPKAMRPVSNAEECFYCNQPIGAAHKPDCVMIQRKVKIRLTVEYEVSVPAGWEAHDIEFHRNEGGWCANNAIDELSKAVEGGGCLCDSTTVEYLEDTSEPFLDE